MSINDAQGLSAAEYGDWLRRGGSAHSHTPSTDPEEPYVTFCELLEQMVIATKTVATANILRAIWSGDVDASKYFLERRRAQEWGQRGPVPLEFQSPDRTRVVFLPPDNGRGDTPYYEEES